MNTTFLPKHIEEFLLVKDAEGLSTSCYGKYKASLEKFRKWLNDEPVTKMKYYEYLAYLQSKNYSDWTQKSDAQVIKTCFRYLISAGYDFPNPDFKMPKIHKKKLLYLEPDQIKKLMKSNLCQRDLIVMRLFLSTGMRLNELVMLDWQDINFRTGAIAVNYGKGDKFRFVITDKPTLVLLMKYKNKLNITDLNTPLFMGDRTRITRRGVMSIINRVRTKTGIYFYAHCLRRTFARQAVINGMGIEFLQQLMGHESLELTKHYVGQLDTEDLVKNYNKHLPLAL